MEVDDPQPPSPDISSLKEAAKEIMEKSDGDSKSENGDNKVNGSVMNGDSNGNGNGDSSPDHEDEDGGDEAEEVEERDNYRYFYSVLIVGSISVMLLILIVSRRRLVRALTKSR